MHSNPPGRSPRRERWKYPTRRRAAHDLLPVFAVYELLPAAFLLTPRFTYVASLLAALTLVGIVVANPDPFEVLFRNVAIACAALALALGNHQGNPPSCPRHCG